MPGAFNGTASSTISQMEKMLTVFSPLYEKCFPRRWDISGWYRDDRECRTLRGVVGRKSSAKVQFSAATFECAKLSGPGRTVSGSKQNPSFSKLRVAALVIGSADPWFGSHAAQLGVLALRNKVPAIYFRREFVAAGGLMSYGGSITETYRLAGLYAGRILKGEKPSDLPVQQVTKVELFINLKVAKTLGITIPLPLSGRADELIE